MDTPKPKKKIRFWRWFFGTLVVCLAAVGWLAWALFQTDMGYHVTISEETTFVTGPLDEDGKIDYVAAVNEMLSEGVTRENNAMMLLAHTRRIEVGQVIDGEVFALDQDQISPVSPQASTEFYQKLGMSLPEIDSTIEDSKRLASFREKLNDVYLPLLISAQAASMQEFLDENDPPPGTPAKLEHSDPSVAEAYEALKQYVAIAGEMREHKVAPFIFESQYQHAAITPWTAERFPVLAHWVEDQDEALTAIAEKCRRPRFYFPVFDMPAHYSLCQQSYKILGEVTRGLAVRAMHRIGEGDISAAWDDIYAMKSLARHLVCMGTDFFSKVEHYALPAVATIVHHPDLTDELRERIVKDLDELEQSPYPEELINRAGRCHVFHGILRIPRKNFIRASAEDTAMFRAERNIFRRRVDWSEILRRFNVIFDEMETLGDEMHSKYIEQFDAIVEKHISPDAPEPLDPWKLAVNPKATDRCFDYLASLILSSMKENVRKACRKSTYQRMTKLVVALTDYYRQHGDYPDRLEQLLDGTELDPETLIDPVTPKDRFRYHKTPGSEQGYLLYGLDLDRTDQGGEAILDDSDELISSRPPSDISIRVGPQGVITKTEWDVEQCVPIVPEMTSGGMF